ncbi:MAG: S24 family peptidase [Bacillota bacterium]
MSYSETLFKMVEKSGLTLRDIADKCRDKGFPIDPSYISKLQTKKQGPATEEVNRVIAQVCGGDAEALILEAYIEKSPEPVRDLLFNLISVTRQIATVTAGKILSPEVASYLDEKIKSESPMKAIKSLMEAFDGMLKSIESGFKFETKLPVLLNDPAFQIFMHDTSMQPLIPQGAHANIIVEEKYNSNDVLVLQLTDAGPFTIRRVIDLEDQLVLIPENKEYEVKIVPKTSLSKNSYIGKVISVTVNI